MKYDIAPVFMAILTLFSVVITSFIIPIAKQKLSEAKREKLRFWVETAVTAAEQIYGSKTGRKKKEYAVQFLLSKGIVFDVDEVVAMLESEVYKLNKQKSS